jgi:hypothetical protein
MSSFPVEPDARARLHDEQAAETAAVRAVQRAQDALAKQQARLETAGATVAEAIVELVRVSGASRAARLTGESAKAVRQMAREAGLTRDEAQ